MPARGGVTDAEGREPGGAEWAGVRGAASHSHRDVHWAPPSLPPDSITSSKKPSLLDLHARGCVAAWHCSLRLVGCGAGQAACISHNYAVHRWGSVRAEQEAQCRGGFVLTARRTVLRPVDCLPRPSPSPCPARAPGNTRNKRGCPSVGACCVPGPALFLFPIVVKSGENSPLAPAHSAPFPGLYLASPQCCATITAVWFQKLPPPQGNGSAAGPSTACFPVLPGIPRGRSFLGPAPKLQHRGLGAFYG